MAKTPSFMKGKYTKSKDEKMDARLMRRAGITDKDDKAEFEKMDKAHGKKKKPKTIAEDRKKDDAIIKKVKAKEPRKSAKRRKKRSKTKPPKGGFFVYHWSNSHAGSGFTLLRTYLRTPIGACYVWLQRLDR
jgi:hypothetical protein